MKSRDLMSAAWGVPLSADPAAAPEAAYRLFPEAAFRLLRRSRAFWLPSRIRQPMPRSRLSRMRRSGYPQKPPTGCRCGYPRRSPSGHALRSRLAAAPRLQLNPAHCSFGYHKLDRL
jgi:hypothetical protein